MSFASVFLETTNEVTQHIYMQSFGGHVTFWRTDIYTELKQNKKTKPQKPCLNIFQNRYIILRIQYYTIKFYVVIKMIELHAILRHTRASPRFQVSSTRSQQWEQECHNQRVDIIIVKRETFIPSPGFPYVTPPSRHAPLPTHYLLSVS